MFFFVPVDVELCCRGIVRAGCGGARGLRDESCWEGSLGAGSRSTVFVPKCCFDSCVGCTLYGVGVLDLLFFLVVVVSGVVPTLLVIVSVSNVLCCCLMICCCL